MDEQNTKPIIIERTPEEIEARKQLAAILRDHLAKLGIVRRPPIKNNA